MSRSVPDGNVPHLIQALALATMLADRLEGLEGVVADEFLIELRDVCELLQSELERRAPVDDAF